MVATYDYLNDQHAGQTSHVNRASSEMWHDGKADQGADDKARVDTHVEVEGGSGAKPGGFKKDNGIAREWVSIKHLTSPNHCILSR